MDERARAGLTADILDVQVSINSWLSLGESWNFEQKDW